MSTNIRVFVQWKEPTVFAGEDIECVITFKNVAPVTERSPSRAPKTNGFIPPGGDRQRKVTPQPIPTRPPLPKTSSFDTKGPPSHLRGHRPTLSLSSPYIGSRDRTSQLGVPNNGPSVPTHKHGRSLSIISLGAKTAEEGSQVGVTLGPPRRPARGHGRSASVQVLSGRSGSAPFSFPSNRSVTQPPPRFSSASTPVTPHIPGTPQPEFSLAIRHGRRASGLSTAPGTPAPSRAMRKPSGSFSHNFKFPAGPPLSTSSSKCPSPGTSPPPGSAISPRTRTPQLRSHSPRPPEDQILPLQPPQNESQALSPIARILSGTSMNGTPRSSGEFYSMSNNSTETLASEYLPHMHPSGRLVPRNAHIRRTSQLTVTSAGKAPEVLMMGYAQIVGNFILDGALINQAPFEEVKRKGVVGGQGGGGVVGVERTKRESGLFGALGWGNIGESLGGLLGTNEPSSIREMRSMATSKTVPLITTPQSILFVDLRLAPGESRSYKYSFTLPRGLPPSHKGRAMKVSYHLTIGTQRPGSGNKEQVVKQVDVPFRVFGSVNNRGDVLGHDLMAPYILLRDQARTVSLTSPSLSNGISKRGDRDPKSREVALSDFLDYIDNLLEKPRHSSLGLLSPTESEPRRYPHIDEPQSMKEIIDFAILRSNITTGGNQSTNRFKIARSGKRVAVLMLARPSYRIGETITAVLDFSKADIPCYSVHMSLETSEKVDPAIALRSAASIYRVTRKVYASFAENALFARRISFSPTIPPSATPEFITSGINLEWKLKIEFMTPRLTQIDDGDEVAWEEGLLEEVSSDDRGVVLAAMERLPCETFEVAVPIRVYGAIAPGAAIGDEAEQNGLVV